jgi:ubiquinone/menaquinone biosynthesis C-methylase UbiE
MDQNLRLFIPFLRCPVSGKPVREASFEELEKLNASIALGRKLTVEGKFIRRKLKEAFISEDGRFVYSVTDGYLAEMLPEQAISVEENEVKLNSFQEEGKKKVKEFYDEYGWLKDEIGNFNDTVTFEDLRPVSQDYWSRCHLRLNKHLGSGGDYLLDIASGAIPNDEYLTYSKNFKLRICMDFSVAALKGAAARLNGKGIFILGDMTRIPLANNCVDGVISMHTVYHVPQKEQTQAVAEAFRVVKPGKQAVIVYSWKDSGLMQLMFGMYRPLLRVYQNLRNKKRLKVNPQEGRRLELFVEQQNYDWFSKQIQKQFNARLIVYSAISRSFSHTFLRERWLGKQLSTIIYRMEEAFPSFLGRWGQYPVFILRKPS